MALLFTGFGALGLVNYKQCPDEDRTKKRFGRCSVLLALGGLSGLVGAARYSSLMTAFAQDMDATENEGTNTCAAGCALSLSTGLIAVVAGVAAVYIHKRSNAGRASAATNGAEVCPRAPRDDSIDQVEFAYRSGNFQTWGGSGGGESPPFICRTTNTSRASSTVRTDTSRDPLRYRTGRKSQWYGKDEHINGNEQRLLQAAAGHTIIGLQRPPAFVNPSVA